MPYRYLACSMERRRGSWELCVFLSLAAVVMKSMTVQGNCPNQCSMHGECGFEENTGGLCTCEKAWNTTEAPDCSKRACPKGIAWWDHATDVDTAHAMVECSNMGLCDRETGTCQCAENFQGIACERTVCPQSISGGICSGHGRCVSLRELATYKDDVHFFTSTTYDLWDADKTFGCICDVGFTGYDCSLRECPRGYNAVGSTGVTEIQILECTCPPTCAGYFHLWFKNEYIRVEHDFDATQLETALLTSSHVNAATVNLYGGTTVCDADGVSTTIEFTNDPGDQPPIVVADTSRLTSGGSISVSVLTGGATGAQGGTSRDATTAATECSNRGTCSRDSGLCICLAQPGFAGGTFVSSDGAGGAGNRGDCGYDLVTPTACPQNDDGTGNDADCSGHGTCSGTTFECTCFSGYTGFDCSLLECPYGYAWFDEATAPDTAHALAECSNRGICDRSEGTCTCMTGYTGTGCQSLACPTTSDVACNGHGSCYTMAQLAALSESNGELLGLTYGATPSPTTWDHASVRGCYCDQDYFHGPFAWDFGNWMGYDCSLLSCPVGDNPETFGQVNEVQTITCIATSGTFTISFRQSTTAPINYDATVTEMEAAMEYIFSISDVTLTFSGGSTTSACSPNPGTTITVKFKIPGDLPTLTLDTSLLGGATVTVVETVKGTTEAVECSGQGICDRTSGICSCFPSFVSSDGSGDGETKGQRGDCSALDAFGGQ